MVTGPFRVPRFSLRGISQPADLQRSVASQVRSEFNKARDVRAQFSDLRPVFIARKNVAVIEQFLRQTNGQFSKLQGAVAEAYKGDIIPKVQQAHSRFFADAVERGVGRADYRRGGGFSRQRPSRLLERGLKEEDSLWKILGGGGFRLDLEGLDNYPVTAVQSDGRTVRLQQYWRIQHVGTTQFVGRQVVINSPSRPGYEAIRDTSKQGRVIKRRASLIDAPENAFRTGTVKRAIRGYRLDLLGERALRAVFESEDITRALLRAMRRVGITPSTTVGGVELGAEAAEALRTVEASPFGRSLNELLGSTRRPFG